VASGGIQRDIAPGETFKAYRVAMKEQKIIEARLNKGEEGGVPWAIERGERVKLSWGGVFGYRGDTVSFWFVIFEALCRRKVKEEKKKKKQKRKKKKKAWVAESEREGGE